MAHDPAFEGLLRLTKADLRPRLLMRFGRPLWAAVAIVALYFSGSPWAPPMTPRPSAAAVGPARPASVPLRPAPERRRNLVYEKGVDLYAAGRLREAAASFAAILDADPTNEAAARALLRVRAELDKPVTRTWEHVAP